MSYTQNEEN